jgi:hypothetical protein
MHMCMQFPHICIFAYTHAYAYACITYHRSCWSSGRSWSRRWGGRGRASRPATPRRWRLGAIRSRWGGASPTRRCGRLAHLLRLPPHRTTPTTTPTAHAALTAPTTLALTTPAHTLTLALNLALTLFPRGGGRRKPKLKPEPEPGPKTDPSSLSLSLRLALTPTPTYPTPTNPTQRRESLLERIGQGFGRSPTGPMGMF